jgi:glycosyltransferase involved in cell wall biosynthesis
MRTLVALMIKDASPVGEATNQSLNQKSFPRTILLIPTLNEADAIHSLVTEAKDCGFGNILVVDGFSTDRTREVAGAAGARVNLQEFGKGKGCGVRTGMKLFLEGNAHLLCIIDGDGTNIPSDILAMVRVGEEASADVVLGSRIRGKRSPQAMSRLAFASNLTVSFLLGAKFGRLFTDVQTGYWVFTRAAVQIIYPLIHSTGFEIEIELFVTALKQNLKVLEMPVGFRARIGTTKFSLVLRLRNLLYAFRYLAS